ncbi:hypothetical protein QYM36_001545 [Artemia franciscana]|uniref:b(0,+)-type amino acid transporter 1 n=1 Tax=Artemia franciscana TaxID=6661 RepID=A0AA88IDD3_ARTSF|nr:hypothetical protein QYM36_001545 [Artemia franciscana]
MKGENNQGFVLDEPAKEKSNGGVTVPGITAENAQGGEEDLGNSKSDGSSISSSESEVNTSDADKGKDKLGGSSTEEVDAVHLKRRVGLFSGVALIVGTMIGSGIFVSPSGLLYRSESVATCLIIWGACGALSMLGALSYAELGTMITQSGAEYSYFLEAFGPMPAFLFCWVSTFLLKPSQLAIISLSFAKYTVEPFIVGCEPPDLVVKLVCAATIASITFINCYSVSLATKVQNIFTAAKLIAIFIIICGGIYMIALGNVSYLSTGFEPFDPSLSPTTFSDIATAFYSGLWAYDGWNNLNYVTEELKNPFVNLPRAIIIGLPLVTGCYILVNVAYLAVLSPIEMINSPAVAVTFGARALASWAWLMPLAVCVSTFGSANGTLFVGGRLSYVASREGHLVDILSYVHVRRLTPSPALLFNTLIALLMIIPGNIGSLIDFFSFTAWIFYGGCMAALILMRYTRPNAPRPYKVPIIMPIIVLIVSVYLVVAPIVEDPQIEYLYATMFILAGLIFYIPFIYYKVPVKCMGPVTAFLQYLLEVVPTKYE